MGAGDPEITLAKIELPVSKQDTARVVDAVLDVFSPLTETLGTLGDHVRLYRTRSVLQALAETKKLAESSGLKLKQPPLKFLLPYLEGVSKEDSEDQGLMTMWANLLLQSSSENAESHPLLVEILGRLTSKDAVYLEKIVRNPRYLGNSVNQIGDVAFEFERFYRVNDAVDKLIATESEADVISKLIHQFEDRGIIVTSCGFYSIGDEGEEWDIVDDYEEFPSSDELCLHSLAALGLVRYPYNVVRQHKGGTFIITICVLTELGAEFYLTTHAPQLRESGSELPRYED